MEGPCVRPWARSHGAVTSRSEAAGRNGNAASRLTGRAEPTSMGSTEPRSACAPSHTRAGHYLGGAAGSDAPGSDAAVAGDGVGSK